MGEAGRADAEHSADRPGAQANSIGGWAGSQFTDAAIRILNEQDRPIVFILWGSPAQKKAQVRTTRSI